MAKVWTQRLRLAKRSNIYEAFFYRGPDQTNLRVRGVLPGTTSMRACLPFDATPDRAMLQAWDGLHPRIGKGCWEGAGIYVMILRGRK
jgi:hypothetical protein